MSGAPKGVREVDPLTTPRAASWAFHRAPMPMVTILQTWDITPLVRLHREQGYRLNLLLCWCIGCAAQETKEFFLLPDGERCWPMISWASVIVANQVFRISPPVICLCSHPWQTLTRPTGP